MSAPTVVARPPRTPRSLVSRHPVLATAEVAVGMVLVGVGLGTGVPWAANVGLAPVTVASVLALVCGLALLVGGMWALGKRLGRGGRWLLVPATLATTLIVTYVVAVPVAVVAAPRADIGSRTPADQGLTFRSMQMPSRSGEVLAGWYVPTLNGAAVVLRHGSSASRTSVLDHAAVLARHGYGVLLTDARGHGMSTGRPMAWGWHGDDDVYAAIDVLKSTPGVDPSRIGVVGLSMGGEEALGAAAFDQRIRAVVAEGATGRSPADLGWLATAYGWRGQMTLAVRTAQSALVDLISDASPPTSLGLAVSAMSPRPVLLVAAGEVADEQYAARALAANSTPNVHVWVVPGAGHTKGLQTAPQDWERRVVTFLDESLQEG